MKLKAFIKKDMLLFIKRNRDTLMLFVKKNNTPIGYINIDLDESHDLGYGLKKEYWHQGIVSEAVKSIIQQSQKRGLII